MSWRRRRSSSEIATATVPDRAGVGFDDAYASRDEMWAMLARLAPSPTRGPRAGYFEDLDDQRIADLVGVPASTVRTHAHRGLAALRETLTERADDAPSGPELLANVRRGVARAAVRRRAATAGGIAALVAALLLAVAILLPDRNDQPVEPTPSFTSDLELVPTTLTAPEFPYAFGYLPPDVGPGYVALGDDEPLLYFGSAHALLGTSLSIAVHAGQQPVPDFLDPHEESATTVNGLPARQWVTLPAAAAIPDNLLEWQQDGLWLYVRSGTGAYSIDELHRVAEGMRPGRTTSTVDAISRVALPGGYEVSGWDQDTVCAVPAALGSSTALCIWLLPADVAIPTTTNGFTLDGDPARVSTIPNPNRITLLVERGDGRAVDLTHKTDGTLFTTGDLVAIYRGIVFEP